MADEAVAIAQMTNTYTVDSTGDLCWNEHSPEPSTGSSAAQRRFLSALVDNDECWGKIANPMIWFGKAGLPTKREELRALLT